jgi:hypothetical protein
VTSGESVSAESADGFVGSNVMPRMPPEVNGLFPSSLPWRKASLMKKAEAIGQSLEKVKTCFKKVK